MQSVAYPVYEVKAYDLVVLEFTRNHGEADLVYRQSNSRVKTLTRILPNGQRQVLQRQDF